MIAKLMSRKKSYERMIRPDDIQSNSRVPNILPNSSELTQMKKVVNPEMMDRRSQGGH